MYFVFDEENEFQQRLNPVAMAKRQIPNGYKNTTKSLIKGIRPLKQNQNITEQEDYFGEDAHLRSRLISGEQYRRDANKIKFVRADQTKFDGKGYNNFIKAHSSPRQYREHLRSNIRIIKAVKKEMNTNPKYADIIKHGNPSYKNYVLGKTAEGMRMAGGAYYPSQNMITINKSQAMYKDPLFRHKTLSHELVHKNQFDMIKAKEGHQGLRRARKNYETLVMKGTKDKLNPGMRIAIGNYFKNPLEYQAHKIAADTNSLRDRKFRNIDPKYADMSRDRNKLANQFRKPSFRVDDKLYLKSANLDKNKITQRDLMLSRFNKDYNKRYLEQEAKIKNRNN